MAPMTSIGSNDKMSPVASTTASGNANSKRHPAMQAQQPSLQQSGIPPSRFGHSPYAGAGGDARAARTWLNPLSGVGSAP